jgi:hypothetical protein
MRIEKITRKGEEFAVIPVDDLQKRYGRFQDAFRCEAYDAAKAVLRMARTSLFPSRSSSVVLPAKAL